MLSPYGRSTLLKTFLLCALFAVTGLFFPGPVKILPSAIAAVFFLFSLYFFRDPPRTPPHEPNAILAPADGRILLIKKISHPFTGEESTLISIFMSPFNVHINRIPMSGRIELLTYHQGKYLMAFDHESMNNNERMEIGLENSGFRIFFIQVAGFFARRIVCNLEIGEQVQAGNSFGMIKFGSRLDVIVPADARLVVFERQKTLAGETVLAMRNI